MKQKRFGVFSKKIKSSRAVLASLALLMSLDVASGYAQTSAGCNNGEYLFGAIVDDVTGGMLGVCVPCPPGKSQIFSQI